MLTSNGLNIANLNKEQTTLANTVIINGILFFFKKSFIDKKRQN